VIEHVTDGSPAVRAGLRIYDVIVAVDGRPVKVQDELIAIIAGRKPGTTATLQIVRDGRTMNVPVKLAERPLRERAATDPGADDVPQQSSRRDSALGLSVRVLDDDLLHHLDLPPGTRGVVVSRVDPMGPAFDADIQRGHVLLQINRHPVRSVEDYQRLIAAAHSGDVLTLYLYKPEARGTSFHTIKVD
jgi:serine protease Do